MSLTFSKSSRVRAANISLQSAMAAFRACSGETLYAVEELNENANSGVGNAVLQLLVEDTNTLSTH